MEQLCPGDRAILNSLFNPLLPIGEGVMEDSEPQHSVVDEESSDVCTAEARNRNVAGVKATEENHQQEALEAFNEAITLCPKWSAPYNNRAQLHRIMRKEDEAIADLEKAIELSGGQGMVGCQALLQRGLLHRLKGEDDQARERFKGAADLGSNFAKQQLISLNPMAALCNKMLVKMVMDVQNGVTVNE